MSDEITYHPVWMVIGWQDTYVSMGGLYQLNTKWVPLEEKTLCVSSCRLLRLTNKA